MKKIFYLAGCLLLAGTLCWSCSDDDGLGDGNGNGSGNSDVALDKGTPTEQVVYADQEGIKNEGIKFTTKGPWKAEVEEVAARAGEADGKAVDWLTLSQYSGDQAGAYTLTLTLKQNYTGKSRKAVIRIICGETVITVTVEQKAENNDGVKLKRVKSVAYIENFGPFYENQYYNKSDNVSYTYSYDEQGRVANLVQSWEDEASTFSFDYGIEGKITVIEKNKDFDSDLTETNYEYHLTLNNEGKVENINSEDRRYQDTKVTYTEDGRLLKLSGGDYYDMKNGWTQEFSYTKGLMTKAEYMYPWNPNKFTYDFDVAKVYPNRYSATRANINFNAFITELGYDDELESLLLQIGLLGMGSDCLMEINPFSDDEEISNEPNYSEPGKVYKHNPKETKYQQEMNGYPVKYEFDGDKYVTKFSYAKPYEVYEHYYEIHVGHELIDSNRPEMGYKYEIKNEKWTKLSDEKNTFTYTVTYE